MPDAAIVTLIKGVVSDLNSEARDWSQQFKAERKYNPKETLERINENLVVMVAPGGGTFAPDNRTDWEQNCDVDIFLLKIFSTSTGQESTNDFDAMMLLMQEIGDYFAVNRPTYLDGTSLSGVAFGATADAGQYSRDFAQRNGFVGAIRLTFSIVRDPNA